MLKSRAALLKTNPGRSGFTDWQVIGFLLVLAVIVRWQTFGNPVLEYDEQFYLLVGDRMLHGALPFVDIFDRKPVGLFLIYAAIRLLGGGGVIQYQIAALFFVVATAALLYKFASRLTSQFGAISAAFAYILWLNITEGHHGLSHKEVWHAIGPKEDDDSMRLQLALHAQAGVCLHGG